MSAAEFAAPSIVYRALARAKGQKMETSPFFSRESLAGYEPRRMRDGVVVVVGAGAAANNVVQTAALSGVGELRIIDFDTVEPSNLTRSPLFRRERIGGRRRRFKAREVALSALAISFADDPICRYATERVERLGLGAFEGAHVIISAVDSFEVRAYLADVSRLLGIPLVEVGFSAPRGQVSVSPNRSAEEPCWRCLHPSVGRGAFSCEVYARGALAQGFMPATQSVAALFGALTAEAAIQALHGLFPLANRALQMDIRTGTARVLEITADPACPGEHRMIGNSLPVPVSAHEPASAVLEAARAQVAGPIVQLRSVYVIEAPCALCGRPCQVDAPVWAIPSAPTCGRCPEARHFGGHGPVTAVRVEEGDLLARKTCRALGFAPADLIEVRDGTWVRLAGTLEDLFLTFKRRPVPAPSEPTCPQANPEERADSNPESEKP